MISRCQNLPLAEACGSCFGDSGPPGDPLPGVLGVVGVAGCCFDEEVVLTPEEPEARGGDVFDVPVDETPERGRGMCEPAAGFEDEFHAGCCSLSRFLTPPLLLALPLPASLEARI